MQPLLTFRNLVYICADLLLYNAVICDKEVLISCSATSLVNKLEVDDVNPSQLGEAQYAVAHLSDLARSIIGCAARHSNALRYKTTSGLA